MKGRGAERYAMNLSPVERAILEHLRDSGDDVPANIADEKGFHMKSVSRSVSDLEDRGLVENKGRGVYRSTQDGFEKLEAAEKLDED